MNNGYGSGKDTLQTALKDLYVKLGGQASAVADEYDINTLIREIGDLDIGGGGSGGGGGALMTFINEETGVLDKTLGEIIAAMPHVYVVSMQSSESGTVTDYRYIPPYGYMVRSNGYGEIYVTFDEKKVTFAASSLDAYPSFSSDSGGSANPKV